MTNKEAIFELIKFRRRLEKYSAINVEPFDMAIEALKETDYQHEKQQIMSKQLLIYRTHLKVE